jgi:hypothetical protein
LQFRDVPVIVIADHQRDALFRLRGGGKRHQSNTGDCQKSGKPAHH